MSWTRFGFNELQLAVPETWALARFGGDARAGTLLLDDGANPVLEAEWAPLGGRALDRLEQSALATLPDARVRRRVEIDAHLRAALAEHDEAGRCAIVVLEEAPRDRYVILRLYHLPNDAQGFVRTLTKPLLEAREGGAQRYRWRFLSASFDLAEGFLLQEADLRAGCARLTFRREGRRLTLWLLALLDRLEAREDDGAASVRAFARGEVMKAYPRRFRFAPEPARTGPDPAAFLWEGRLRRRWRLWPGNLFFGNARLRLEAIPERGENRLALLLFEYRRAGEEAWLEPLRASLGRPE